ncbi:MAG: LacI family transcriptional regulator [Paracoccaceae bacterium]
MSEEIASRGEKPTLKTIAGLTGLAVPTISRALNDAPDIGAETKRLVRKIATEIGYVPNRAGVRLRTGRTNVIALVMSTEHDVMNHTARLISSVAGGLRDTRFHLNVTPYFPGEDPMKPVRYIVETGSADAVILNQIEPEDPRIAYLMERSFPFATHGRTNWFDKHSYYDFDNTRFGEIATQRLCDRRRKHIALLAPPMRQHYAQHMAEGVSSTCAANDVSYVRIEGITSDSPGNMIVSQLHAFLDTHPEIDGIVVGSTSAALAVVTALEERGMTVGQEVDIFTKEAVPFIRLFRPDILSLSEAVGEAGHFLAQAAIQAIKDPSAPPMQALEVPTGD